MELKFRNLRADEVECRIAQCKEKGLSLLIYKDARCDQNILDETVGSLNWKNVYSRDNANCTVFIFDEDKNEWVGKENTGSESNTEAQKGLASDSFKRACFNWGIGRELYTAPFIWITSSACNIKPSGRKDNYGKDIFTCKDKFTVTKLNVENKKITGIEIVNDTTKQVVYGWGNISYNAPKPQTAPVVEETDDTKPSAEQLAFFSNYKDEERLNKMLAYYGVKSVSEMTFTDCAKAMVQLQKG